MGDISPPANSAAHRPFDGNTVEQAWERAVEQYRLPGHLDVDAPVLVLTGTTGPDLFRASAHSVHETLSDSCLVEFDGISHSDPGKAPALIAAEVDAFLQE